MVEAEFITAFTGGLTGMAPIALPLFIYLHLNLKYLAKHDEERQVTVAKLEEKVRAVELKISSDEKVTRKIQSIDKEIERLRNIQVMPGR